MAINSAVLRKVSTIRNIPTLPEVLHEVLATVASDDSSADDLATIISRDPAICSRVLRMANSAFYAQNRSIVNIGDAVVVLGFDAIVQLMLATTALTAFDTRYFAGGFTMRGLWKHSIATALISRIVAEKAGKETDCHLAYTSGLLHDVGKLVLAHYFPADYAPVFEMLDLEDLHLHEAEKEVLGFTHCDMAEWLFRRWNFPDRLVNLVISHHDNMWYGSGKGTEGRALNLANILSNKWSVGTGGNLKEYPLRAEYYGPFGLDTKNLNALERKVREMEKEIDLFLKELILDLQPR